MARSLQSRTRQHQAASSTRVQRRRDNDKGGEPPMLPPGIQTIGSAIAWLSTASIGIGAIFGVLGFLASSAYVGMLGLPLESLHYSNTFYIQRGGIFVVMLLVETAPYLILVLFSGLLVLFVSLGLRWLCQRLEIRRPFLYLSGHHQKWRFIAYVVLLLLLARQASSYLRSPDWMTVSGILQSDAHEQATTISVREWILSGNKPLLLNQFAYFANQQVWIGALLVLAWVVSRSYRWRVLGTAPFALIFVTSIVYLALEYGTLAWPIEFREASIPAESPIAKLYLLRQTDEGYVFWDCRQARWIPQQTRVNFFQVRALREIIATCQTAGR